MLEILIAMTLASLVLLTLSVSGGYVLRQWSREKNSLDDSLEQALLALRLERALAGAYPHAYRDRGKKNAPKKLFFEGDRQEVTWVSTVSFGTQTGLAAWRLIQEDDSVSLYIVPRITGDPADRLDESRPVAIWQGWNLEIQYLEEKEINGRKPERTWRTEWQAEKARVLPAAVEIILSDTRGDTTIPLVVPIRANEHETIKPSRTPNAGSRNSPVQAPVL